MPRVKPKRALEVGSSVYLRQPTARDRNEFVALNRASRELHTPWVTAPTTSASFDRWLERSHQPDVKSFLVCRVEDDAIAGAFTLSQIFRRGFQSAYLGYYVGAPFADKGYMRDGLQLVLRHVFTTMKLHRVEANVQPENVASIALVKGSGFRLEGFSPRYLKIAAHWRDHQRWAMTVEDWRTDRRGPGVSAGPPSPQQPFAPSPGRRRR